MLLTAFLNSKIYVFLQLYDCNVSTHGECAWPAYATDERIRRREGCQDGDADYYFGHLSRIFPG